LALGAASLAVNYGVRWGVSSDIEEIIDKLCRLFFDVHKTGLSDASICRNGMHLNLRITGEPLIGPPGWGD
jgi:hypothetical protein